MTVRLVHELLDERALQSPHAPAVVRGDDFRSYRELAVAVVAAVGWLRAHGVRRGDRVLVLAPHAIETVVLLYAASRIGAIYVVVSDQVRPYHLEHILTDSEPALVVIAGAARVDGARCPVRHIDELPADGPQQADGPLPIGTDVASLIYTSGSTAMPKAVVSTHEQVVFAVDAIAERLDYRPDDRVLCCLPLSFDYGLYQVFLCVRAGACLVLGDDDHAGPALLSTLESNAITVLPLVPGLAATLDRLARRASRLPATLRLVTNTGAALSPTVSAQLRAHNLDLLVIPMYGLTECKRVSIETPNADLVRPGSVGRPLPGTEVLVLDDNGKSLPAGEVGQLAVRGPHVMAGYWRAPELTRQRFPRDEFGRTTLLTGDRGWLDTGGHVYFAGRDGDVYKQNGFRVSAIEIEGAAADIPGVDEVAVLPPSGNRPAVLAVVGSLDGPEIRRGLLSRLESHKVPDQIRLVESLPHGVNGKIDKRALEAAL